MFSNEQFARRTSEETTAVRDYGMILFPDSVTLTAHAESVVQYAHLVQFGGVHELEQNGLQWIGSGPSPMMVLFAT